jgi:hypothetical protein
MKPFDEVVLAVGASVVTVLLFPLSWIHPLVYVFSAPVVVGWLVWSLRE